MRTVFPSGTGCEDSARQSSPWTRTIPSSPAFNSAVTVPWQPINSSFPVAVFHFRDRSTNFISTTAKTPNGSVADNATPRLTPPAVNGERIRNTAPKNMETIPPRSEEHTSELQSRLHLVCRLLLEKKKKKTQLEKAQRRPRSPPPPQVPRPRARPHHPSPPSRVSQWASAHISNTATRAYPPPLEHH